MKITEQLQKISTLFSTVALLLLCFIVMLLLPNWRNQQRLFKYGSIFQSITRGYGKYGSAI